MYLKVPENRRIIPNNVANISEGGEIKSTKDNLMLFIFMFNKKTPCSDSNQLNLEGAGFNDLEIDSVVISRTMKDKTLCGWSFFCLNQPSPVTPDYTTYIFPMPKNEAERVIALKEAIKKI